METIVDSVHECVAEDPVEKATEARADAEGLEKRELEIEDAYDETGFGFSTAHKWWILTVVVLIQTSMNLNSSMYSNGQGGISERFGVSLQAARVGAAVFLVLYAFACELWAPWSEEFGRWPMLELSLTLSNLFQLPVALAPNFGSVIVGRCMGGLCSAGGSVTLAMIADMFDSDEQQFPICYVALSSVGGSIVGSITGGFIEQWLVWQWAMWVQLIIGGFVQILHFFFVPETRTTIMLDRAAKRRRQMGIIVYGPDELHPFMERFSCAEVVHIWARPFKMFVTEPIVLCLSLLSGFSDGLILMLVQCLALIYGTMWNFKPFEIGLAFVPIFTGYLLGAASFIPAIKRTQRQRLEEPSSEHAQFESRLWWLLFTAPMLPIGLLIFALTCNFPHIHWIGSMIALSLIGIANYSIYMATIDYMICAYGPFSASATGGNGWARDFLAGVLTVPATPFYQNIRGPIDKPFMIATLILMAISVFLVGAVFVIYYYGPELRKMSSFAESLDDAGPQDEDEPEEQMVQTSSEAGMDMPQFSAMGGPTMSGGLGSFGSGGSHTGSHSGSHHHYNALNEAAHHMRKGHEPLPRLGPGAHGSAFEASHVVQHDHHAGMGSHMGSRVNSQMGSFATNPSGLGVGVGSHEPLPHV